jgi:hypothetical protein
LATPQNQLLAVRSSFVTHTHLQRKLRMIYQTFLSSR